MQSTEMQVLSNFQNLRYSTSYKPFILTIQVRSLLQQILHQRCKDLGSRLQDNHTKFQMPESHQNRAFQMQSLWCSGTSSP